MSEALVLPVLQARTQRQYLTTRTGFVVDAWAITRWNASNQAAIDAYTDTTPTGDLRAVCDCGTRTTHHTGVCYQCRRVEDRYPARSLYQPCEGPGCHVRTLHESHLCHYCRINFTRYARAINSWYVCTRPGCGKATRNAAGVCCRCQEGKPPKGPGDHWSLRWRNFLDGVDATT